MATRQYNISSNLAHSSNSPVPQTWVYAHQQKPCHTPAYLTAQHAANHRRCLCTCLLLQLVLRSINSARSAFLAINFSANFFESYSVFGGTGLVQAGVLLKVRPLALPEDTMGLCPVCSASWRSCSCRGMSLVRMEPHSLHTGSTTCQNQ